MVHRVRHLVEVAPVRGVVGDLAPPLDREYLKRHHGSQSYDLLEGQVAGVIKLAKGAILRCEQRPGAVLFGWAATGPRRDYLRDLHAMGGDGCAFYVIKGGRLFAQDPWQPAFPQFASEAIKKIEVARLDSPNGTVSLEYGGTGAEINVLVDNDRVEDLRTVCKAFGVSNLFEGLVQTMKALDT